MYFLHLNSSFWICACEIHALIIQYVIGLLIVRSVGNQESVSGLAVNESKLSASFSKIMVSAQTVLYFGVVLANPN